MKRWVGLVGWPIIDGLPHKWKHWTTSQPGLGENSNVQTPISSTLLWTCRHQVEAQTPLLWSLAKSEVDNKSTVHNEIEQMWCVSPRLGHKFHGMVFHGGNMGHRWSRLLRRGDRQTNKQTDKQTNIWSAPSRKATALRLCLISGIWT